MGYLDKVKALIEEAVSEDRAGIDCAKSVICAKSLDLARTALRGHIKVLPLIWFQSSLGEPSYLTSH